MKILALFVFSISAFAQSPCQGGVAVCIGPVLFSGSGLNDATSGGRYTPAPANSQYVVAISATGTPDHFKWSKNGGALSAAIAITGAAQTITDGVTIAFAATTGHTLGDTWTFTTQASGTSAGTSFAARGAGAIVARSVQEKLRESVSVQDFGADPTGRKDSAPAFQNCLDYVSSVGGLCDIPAGAYTVGSHLSLPAAPALIWPTIGLVGRGSVDAPGFGNKASVIQFTDTSGADFLSVTASVFADPTYIFRGFSVIGPDMVTSLMPATTVSGSGIKVSGGGVAGPRVLIDDVSVSWFNGNGTAALWLDGPEGNNISNFKGVENNGCIWLTGSANATHVVNPDCIANQQDAIYIEGSESIQIVGGSAQNNKGSGLHIRAGLSVIVDGTHFEQNNQSATAGVGAVTIETAAPGCDAQGNHCSAGGGFNEFIKMRGTTHNTVQDTVICKNAGGFSSTVIEFDPGYAPAIGGPILDSSCPYWDVVADPSGAGSSAVTATGQQTRYHFGATTYTRGPTSLNYLSPVGIGTQKPEGWLDVQVPPTNFPTLTITGAATATYLYSTVTHYCGGAVGAGCTGTQISGQSGVSTTVIGPTTLDATHFITISWPGLLNAVCYDVYRVGGGATQGKIASCVSPAVTTSIVDNGLPADGTIAPKEPSISAFLGGPLMIGSTLAGNPQAAYFDYESWCNGTQWVVATRCRAGRMAAALGYTYWDTISNGGDHDLVIGGSWNGNSEKDGIYIDGRFGAVSAGGCSGNPSVYLLYGCGAFNNVGTMSVGTWGQFMGAAGVGTFASGTTVGGSTVARAGVATASGSAVITCSSTSTAVPSGGGTPTITTTCSDSGHTHTQN